MKYDILTNGLVLTLDNCEALIFANAEYTQEKQSALSDYNEPNSYDYYFSDYGYYKEQLFTASYGVSLSTFESKT